MSEVKIRIRDNGPLVVEGPFTLTDAAGAEFTLASDKPAFALCRCGLSSNRPFCDGSHKAGNFQCQVRVPGK